jgi:hypothetical protein
MYELQTERLRVLREVVEAAIKLQEAGIEVDLSVITKR